MKRGELTHAMQWEADPAIDRVRASLVEMISDPWSHSPRGWSFALMKRMHPSPSFSRLPVVGVVTLTESAYLTHALIQRLPSPLYLAGGFARCELVGAFPEKEVEHEPVPGVLVRMIGYRDKECSGSAALSPHEIGSCGLLFATALPSPPPGWPA